MIRLRRGRREAPAPGAIHPVAPDRRGSPMRAIHPLIPAPGAIDLVAQGSDAIPALGG
jgi:hypothetical protein